MTDIRRMNVGLTRAKSSLWILGDSRALVQGEFWAKLIQDAKARDRYTRGDVLAVLRKPTEKVKLADRDGFVAPKSSDVEMTDAHGVAFEAQTAYSPTSRNSLPPPRSIGAFNDKGEVVPPVPRGMGPPQIGDSKKRPREGGEEPTPKRQVGHKSPIEAHGANPTATTVPAKEGPTQFSSEANGCGEYSELTMHTNS